MTSTQTGQEEETTQCISCSKTLHPGQGCESDSPRDRYRSDHGSGGRLCFDCAVTCENCASVVGTDRVRTVSIFRPAMWCEECCEDYLSYCEGCEVEVLREESFYCEDECDGDFCQSCYDDHVAEHGSGPLHDYGYKPDPIFMGKGPRYFGVELEIDGAGQDRDKAEKILVHSKQEELYYIKTDSSLDAGMEIVTHPGSLDYHLNRFPWDAISKTARDLGYKSHDAGTCGLHVHVSRAALGKTHTARELTVSKLIVLLWRHWHKLYTFSRRSSDSWCRQQYDFEKLSQAGLDDAKTKGHSVALNVEHYDTIEFRMFRGSLNTRTLKAALRMVDVLVNMAMSHGILWIAQSRWEDILAECESDRNLWQYLEVRELI
jgi:hypothetical protein